MRWILNRWRVIFPWAYCRLVCRYIRAIGRTIRIRTGSSKFEIGQIARRQWAAKQISPISNRRRIRVTLQLSSIQISTRARCAHIRLDPFHTSIHIYVYMHMYTRGYKRKKARIYSVKSRQVRTYIQL